MEKAPDAFRTISEVAEWLETPAHVLRFWESRFAQIKPVKRAGGRRYYRPDDMALLGGIKHLLHDQGLTIRGVQKILAEQGVRHVAGLSGATPGPAGETAGNETAVIEHAATPEPAAQHGPAHPDAAAGARQEQGAPEPGASEQLVKPAQPPAETPPSPLQPEFSFDRTPPATAGEGAEADPAPAPARPRDAESPGGHPNGPANPDAGLPEHETYDHPAQSDPAGPDHDMSDHAMIATRLRAGGRIGADDLPQARALAARLAALRLRLTGAGVGGSPRV
jgi:DNA-binding transcriptional MerR regulator